MWVSWNDVRNTVQQPAADCLAKVRPPNLVFGTWQLGGFRGGLISASTAVDLIKGAWKLGIRAFDVSNVYGNGRSEVILGVALSEILAEHSREEAIIIGKCGYLTGIDGAQELYAGRFPACFNERSLLSSAEASLERLGVGYFDCLLLHDPPSEILRSSFAMGTLCGLKEAGLVRWIGASVSLKKLPLVVDGGLVEVVEVPVNEYCLEEARAACTSRYGEIKEMTILARSPFAGGELLRKYPAEELLRRVIEVECVDAVVAGMVSGEEVKANMRALGAVRGSE